MQLFRFPAFHLSLSPSLCLPLLPFLCSCSVNLSQLKEEEVHSLVLNINAKGGGDMEVGGADDMGTIHCLLQITSTNVEEESESHPVDMELVRKRYVSGKERERKRDDCLD